MMRSYWFGKHNDALSRHRRLHDLFSSVDYAKVHVSPPDDPEDEEELDEQESDELDEDDDELTLSPELQNAIAALIAANPTLSKEQAAHWLVHTPHGRTALAHLSKRKESPMPTDRAEGLRDIAKQYGLERICKMITMEGTSHGISEQELFKMADAEAQKGRLPGERPASAFARFFSAENQLELRKAIQIARSTPVACYPTTPVDSTASPVSKADQATAYTQLQQKAAAVRAEFPAMSQQQAFAKVFTDPSNADLAAKAHVRPSAASAIPFPR
jgi:hypothetical protein